MNNLNYIFKILMVLFTSFIVNSSMAQSSLTIDASQLMTNFHFTDSQGNLDEDYTASFTSAFSVGYLYTSSGGFLIKSNFGMRKAGASLIYDDANVIWDMQYADVKLGLGYLFDIGSLKPYLTASPYFAYLLKGDQFMNSQSHDLIVNESMNRIDYGVFVSPGVQVKLFDHVKIYTEFNYMMGLHNFEKNSEVAISENRIQKGYNRSFALTLGAAFIISKNE